MRLSDTIPHVDFTPMTIAWGEPIVAQAIKHHLALGLEADPIKGTTRNRHGNQSRFLDWTQANIDMHVGCPSAIFYSFFRGSIANSCSRIARGLTP